MKDHSELGGMFDTTGVVRGEDGIKRYDGLPRNLVQMLRAAVDQQGAAEAVVERRRPAAELRRAVGPRRPGGRRPARPGVQRGDRVAIRLGNGVDWVLAFLGACWPARSSCRSTPASPRRKRTTWSTDSGAAYVFAPGAALPDGDALAVDDAEPSEPGRDLLHQRHDRASPRAR